jgi:tetratricopeptide (TPR) repeat protein
LIHGQEHLDVAASFKNLDLVYDTPGQYEQALEYHQKSLDIKIGVADDHPEVANNSRMGIGNVLGKMGKHEQALVQSQKGLEVFLGYEHPDVAGSKENIGLVFEAKGEKSEAKQIYSQRPPVFTAKC